MLTPATTRRQAARRCTIALMLATVAFLLTLHALGTLPAIHHGALRNTETATR